MINPLVSIILSTYNWNHDWLSLAIDSVLNQSFVDFELIIINDCSKNDIEKTILKYSEKDYRIVYIKNEQNLRLTKSLNKGIANSKWKYIARIDDDDIWCDKEKLKKQVDFMEQNPDYWLCGTQVIFIDENGKELERIKNPTSDKDIKKSILFGCKFFHSSVVIRKKALEEVWVYSSDWDYSEDHELWLRIWTKYKLHNLDDFALLYRINQNGICFTNSFKQRKSGIILVNKYKSYYPNYILAQIYSIWLIIFKSFTLFLRKIKIYNLIFPIYKKIEKVVMK